MNDQNIVSITVEGLRGLYLDDLIKLVNDFAMENAKCCYWAKRPERTIIEVKGGDDDFKE